MRLIRAVLTVGGFTALSRVFGLVREILFSYLLGASAITDAFFVAFKFPNFFRRLFAEGAFNAAFVPLFARQLAAEGPCQAKETAEQVFAVMWGVLSIFVIGVVIAAPYIIHILAPGFATTPERLEMTVTFIRLTFPYILFISLAALLSGVLNSLDRFAAAAGVPILLNMVMILGLLLIPSYSSVNPGVVLSVSVFIAGILQFLWLYGCCARVGFRLRWRWPRLTPQVRDLFRLMIPGMIGAGVMNINFFIDTIIASYLPEKSVSFLYYADRLNQLPLSIFGIAMGTALLPALSRQLRGGEMEKATHTQTIALNFSLSIALPAAVGLILLAHPIIKTIYGMAPADNYATAKALMAFSLGIPAYILSKIFVASFFARQDTKTPVITGAIAIGCNLVFTLLLIGTFAHVGLALATTLSAWVNVSLLYGLLHYRRWYQIPLASLQLLGKVVISCLFMTGLVLQLEAKLASSGLSHMKGGNIICLLVLIICGVAVFLGTGYGLGIINSGMIKKALKKE